ncbi:hypothetical protein [Flavobacterium psychrotrophum]|uniref:hypothetical protein n=1 Tax=Flavobacterium psychrotrophum TaxID=2294119 RepID=UPI000E315751|nr:hypothetical protein [Flavobacterium psychrotrophum]
MIKQIIAGLCLLLSSVAFSQENNASPYSFYGIGDQKFKGTAENRSMGGLGVLPDSIHINLQNPASYGALKLTTFSVGATTSKTSLATSAESTNAGRTTVDYIAVALPFKKIGVAFGIMPYTSVGYRIKDSVPNTEDNLYRERKFDGSGGLNRVFAGASYKVTKNLAVGADFNYYFGSIETKSIVRILNQSIQYPTREVNSGDYNAVAVNFGAFYQANINKKYTWTTSATYTPEAKINGTTKRVTATISEANDSETVIEDREQTLPGTDMKMASKITVGSGFGEDRKWFVGAEFSSIGNDKLSNRYPGLNNVSFEKGSRFSLGGYYIPKYYSFTSYLSRVTYRAGLRYEKSGLVINNQDINDYAVSLGFGLPLSGTIGSSNLNIGLEYGQRGTKTAGLIQEKYFNLFIGLSLNDRWFVKRKYE